MRGDANIRKLKKKNLVGYWINTSRSHMGGTIYLFSSLFLFQHRPYVWHDCCFPFAVGFVSSFVILFFSFFWSCVCVVIMLRISHVYMYVYMGAFSFCGEIHSHLSHHRPIPILTSFSNFNKLRASYMFYHMISPLLCLSFSWSSLLLRSPRFHTHIIHYLSTQRHFVPWIIQRRYSTRGTIATSCSRYCWYWPHCFFLTRRQPRRPSSRLLLNPLFYPYSVRRALPWTSWWVGCCCCCYVCEKCMCIISPTHPNPSLFSFFSRIYDTLCQAYRSEDGSDGENNNKIASLLRGAGAVEQDKAPSTTIAAMDAFEEGLLNAYFVVMKFEGNQVRVTTRLCGWMTCRLHVGTYLLAQNGMIYTWHRRWSSWLIREGEFLLPLSHTIIFWDMTFIVWFDALTYLLYLVPIWSWPRRSVRYATM